MWLRIRCQETPSSCARGSVLHEQLPGKVGEFQESVVIDIHLFLDILARNGAVAEAGLAQETPARFVKARYHLL